MNTSPSEEMDEGPEKLSPKAKRIASPRWSKHETLVMIEAKRKHELDLQQSATKGRGFAADVNKWDLVSASCRAVGIDRDSKMCRKRWFNLFTEFKKIRDWRRSKAENFWDMSSDERRERKLPTLFDHEVYVAVEALTNGKPDVVFESGSRVNDEGLFSEVDQDLHHGEEIQDEENDLFVPLNKVKENGKKSATYGNGIDHGNGVSISDVAPSAVPPLPGTCFFLLEELEKT